MAAGVLPLLVSAFLVACASFSDDVTPPPDPDAGDGSVVGDRPDEPPDGGSSGDRGAAFEEAPRAIARLPESAVAVACGADDLVVAAGQKLYVVARTGGAGTPIVEADFAIGGVQVVAGQIYYAIPSLGTVLRRPLDDSQAAPFTAVSGASSPRGIHFLGDRLYYVSGSALTSVDPALGTNGNSRVEQTLLTIGAHALQLAPASDRIYVVHVDGSFVAYDYRGDKAFGLPGTSDARGAVATETDVIFTQASDGTIWRGVPEGDSLRQIADGQPGVRGICRTGDDLFWVREDGAVWTLRLR
jgi:hypothetical protein